MFVIDHVFIQTSNNNLRAKKNSWSVKENFTELQGIRKMLLFFSLVKMVQIMSFAKLRLYKSVYTAHKYLESNPLRAQE